MRHVLRGHPQVRPSERNFLNASVSKNFMKRILIRATIVVIAFTLGIASAALWVKRPSTISNPTSRGDCAPRYDESVVSRSLRKNDDPRLFSAFQELPLYAMPDCVDEAYSLTWIPSFDAPVSVRVWRSGDRGFMVAKTLHTRGWSKFGNVKETNSRPLTNYEWREFTELLSKVSYWELPSTIDEIIPHDGAVWSIAGLRAKQ